MTHSTQDHDTKPPVSENTPLLGNATEEPIAPLNDAQIPNHEHHENGSANPESHHEKPLPKLQIFLLCYARMVEPIAFFGIFPFISKMIYENGDIDEADVGFPAGIIVRSPSPSSLLSILTPYVGIDVLIHANAADDPVGPCCGSGWKKAGACHLPHWSVGRDCHLWAQ